MWVLYNAPEMQLNCVILFIVLSQVTVLRHILFIVVHC